MSDQKPTSFHLPEFKGTVKFFCDSCLISTEFVCNGGSEVICSCGRHYALRTEEQTLIIPSTGAFKVLEDCEAVVGSQKVSLSKGDVIQGVEDFFDVLDSSSLHFLVEVDGDRLVANISKDKVESEKVNE